METLETTLVLYIGTWDPDTGLIRRMTLKPCLLDFNPDIAIITEANIFIENPDYEVVTPGYSLLTTKSMQAMGHCRLAVLLKEGTKVEVQNQYMEDNISSVWLKVCKRGGKKMLIGAVYREHSLLRQGDNGRSGNVDRQVERWTRQVAQWKIAARNTDCFVIGDTNVNMNQWNNPDADAIAVTDILKNEIVTEGFCQTVRGDTRFWPHTRNSMIDQCWTNCPLKVISSRNIVRATSDHNVIEIKIRMKGMNKVSNEILSRNYKNMDAKKYSRRMEEVDWTDVLAESNLNIAYDIFERKTLEILE